MHGKWGHGLVVLGLYAPRYEGSIAEAAFVVFLVFLILGGFGVLGLDVFPELLDLGVDIFQLFPKQGIGIPFGDF